SRRENLHALAHRPVAVLGPQITTLLNTSLNTLFSTLALRSSDGCRSRSSRVRRRGGRAECSCGAPLTPGSLLTSVPFVTSVPLNGHIVEPRPAKRRADGVQLCRRVHDLPGPYHGVSSSLATS